MVEATARPLRILQLTTDNKLGGVRVLAEMVGAGLEARGYLVDTMALNTGKGAGAVTRDLLRIARSILWDRYDAVFSYQSAASILGNSLAWLRGIRVRAAHHTAAPEGIRPHWKAIDWLFGRLGITSHYISNSRATTDAFAAWPQPYRRRFRLIGHGVDPLPAPRRQIDWRGRLAIDSGLPVLLASGRLVGQKNHATAILALASLPTAHLIIAGDGPDGAALLALAEDKGVAGRLHLIGPVDRDALGDLFAAADLYVFPSLWETFGLAGVEAGMAGMAIVAADLPVLREVLAEEGQPQMVHFHPPTDADAMKRAIEAALAAPPSVTDRQAYADLLRARHGRERMMDSYERFLLAAIGRG